MRSGAEDMSRSTLLVALLTAGCFADVWGQGSALFPTDTDSDGGSESAASGSADESWGDSFQTVTSSPPTSSETSGADTEPPSPETSGGPANEAPVIISFTIEPDTLHEAGEAKAVVIVSEDVVELTLAGGPAGDYIRAPSQFDWRFVATSKAASDGKYELVLTARDPEGLTDEASATLWVSLPETGAEKCSFEEALGPGWLTAAVYGDDALVVAGALATPALEATVWRLDPDTCQPQAGFPWQISEWSALPQLAPPSQAIGLAVDEDGRMAIAANLGSGLSRRPYVAVLSKEGALEWEHRGPPGQTYSGITAAPSGFVVVGEQLVNELPPRYDGLVESFDEGGIKLWTDTLAAPLPGDTFDDDLNAFDEHPRAIVWSPKLNRLVVVGERYVFENNDKRLRAFSAQYSLKQGLIDAWTSSGLDAVEDGLVALTICGDELVASGWVEDDQDTRSPAARWLDAEGNGSTKRRLDPLAGTTFHGLACDRERKFTAAGSTPSTATALGFRASDDPFLFKSDFDNAGLKAAACDARGFCAVAGLLGDRAWVRVHHP
ncbi:hypothetical protein [Nannocystis punicea]|uniref:Uncharacterized protein n=1 Tax=Nannocystis punicea TaxID=2995304 RepID=A0ABY7GZQ6_9BACT|nr:hypothetical protein [Nannocystis poenicansa]WAS92475.1 hypothetical protein O0S08_40365 [Nannocystis poenicansa]